jgi:hypothetical protein
MSEPKDTKEVKRHVLGYGYMLEESMISEFKRLYPDIILKKVAASDHVEQTERPTIDVSDYKDKPGKALNTNSEGFSFFRAEPGFRADPGFRPIIRAVPSGRKIVSYKDIDGLIRYKYVD